MPEGSIAERCLSPSQSLCPAPTDHAASRWLPRGQLVCSETWNFKSDKLCHESPTLTWKPYSYARETERSWISRVTADRFSYISGSFQQGKRELCFWGDLSYFGICCRDSSPQTACPTKSGSSRMPPLSLPYSIRAWGLEPGKIRILQHQSLARWPWAAQSYLQFSTWKMEMIITVFFVCFMKSVTDI